MFVNTRTGDLVEFVYTNHEGKVATRRVIVRGFKYGANAWYPENQWFLHTYDLDKEAPRSFALANIQATSFRVQ